MRIKAELVNQKIWDHTYVSCRNTYKCPCGKNCIIVDIDNTPGFERRSASFDYGNDGTCHSDFAGIMEDYNSFELIELKK